MPKNKNIAQANGPMELMTPLSIIRRFRNAPTTLMTRRLRAALRSLKVRITAMLMSPPIMPMISSKKEAVTRIVSNMFQDKASFLRWKKLRPCAIIRIISSRVKAVKNVTFKARYVSPIPLPGFFISQFSSKPIEIALPKIKILDVISKALFSTISSAHFAPLTVPSEFLFAKDSSPRAMDAFRLFKSSRCDFLAADLGPSFLSAMFKLFVIDFRRLGSLFSGFIAGTSTPSSHGSTTAFLEPLPPNQLSAALALLAKLASSTESSLDCSLSVESMLRVSRSITCIFAMPMSSGGTTAALLMPSGFRNAPGAAKNFSKRLSSLL
mmetsp:Transcript_67205/g.118821  ORF Transcript_67205/g.118821 Transcript_67205/m.118821 type:complete len:324 (+) Transcript_67205:776-1747(+)